MAYQDVKTPRIYIDWLSYAKLNNLSSGITKTDLDLMPGSMLGEMLGLSPSKVVNFNLQTNIEHNRINLKFGKPIKEIMNVSSASNTKMWVGLFGHNFSTNNVNMKTFTRVENQTKYLGGITPVFNIEPESVDGFTNNNFKFYKDGFTLFEIYTNTSDLLEDADTIQLRFHNDDLSNTSNYPIQIGAIAAGFYFDLPHSPDLKLNMNRDYGVKMTTGTNGKQFPSIGWSGIDNHGGVAPMDFTDSGLAPGRRSGRRTWDLKFSQFSNKYIAGANELTSTLHGSQETSFHSQDDSGNNITTDFSSNWEDNEDVFSRWIDKTNGPTLPFLFAPDKSNVKPDTLAIARLDQSSFKFSQVSHQTYSFSVKIKEQI